MRGDVSLNVVSPSLLVDACTVGGTLAGEVQSYFGIPGIEGGGGAGVTISAGPTLIGTSSFSLNATTPLFSPMGVAR
jgi:hypothetical protein